MTPHLTHEQLCDLIIAAPDVFPNDVSPNAEAAEAAHDHLRDCLLCTAELQALRNSLDLFRHAARSYAGQQYARPTIHKTSIAPSPRYLSHVLYWAVAAVIAIAVLLPLKLYRQHASAPQPEATVIVAPQTMHAQTMHTTESDEALLEGIAQDLSTDVPSPLRPLADPTASASVDTAQSISTQRKN